MKYTANDAVLSECGQFRYTLERRWHLEGREVPGVDLSKSCVFVCLNPSTADASQDDPTIRRCVGFADRWGYRHFVMLNLFAFRATEPRVMYKAADPVGPLNSMYYGLHLAKAGLIVAAWGAHGSFRGRDVEVRRLLDGYGFPLHHLGLTKDGKPKHPLYLKADTAPTLWGVK